MKIVFCLPGRTFSNHFLASWTSTILYFAERNIQIDMVNHYNSNVYFVRNLCLGGDNLKGENQKLWQGNIDYDYIMWIDSDIVWSPNQIMKLINSSEIYPDIKIISGIYRMGVSNTEYATVLNWDLKYFKQNGRFEFLTKEDLQVCLPRLLEVGYTGFGFMLIKKGVFESVGYPWFRPVWQEVETSGIVVKDFTSEDVGFCRTVIEKGYKIYVDPTIIVGHEKSEILY